jgi:hypothetical protein
MTNPIAAFRKLINPHKIPTQNQTYLHNVVIPYTAFSFLNFYYLCTSAITNILLQNWGNYADMSQAVAIYVTFFCDVLLICWFGTQLTQHVRQKD